jgi:hypothetical protein
MNLFVLFFVVGKLKFEYLYIEQNYFIIMKLRKFIATTIREYLNEQQQILLAPNGNKSNLSKKLYEYVRTDEFKNWFGDWENNPNGSSKVIDENDEPLIVYHGSEGMFDKFNKKYRGVSTNAKSAKLAFFFTDNKKLAIEYSRRYAGGQLYECFLNLRNPIIKNFNGESVNTDMELVKLIKTSGDGVISLNLKDGFHIDNQYAVKDDDNIKILNNV